MAVRPFSRLPPLKLCCKRKEASVGPLEQKIYEMTRPDPPRGGGSASASARVVMVMGQLNKIERALLRLAAEVDELHQSASRPA
jgi:hypothetical protein